MNVIRHIALALVMTGAVASTASAQPLPQLTLQEAHELALRNRPAVRSRQYLARSAEQITRQYEAMRYPQVLGSFTAATATREDTTIDGKPAKLDARIAAGGLNNPAVLRRDALGFTASQLVTDFGRTARLIESARYTQSSLDAAVDATREQVLLNVDGAYLSVLEAQSVLRVAEKTVEARQVFRDRVAALAKGKLKSELDLRFAEVALGEARLLLLKARNALDSAFARLSAALGFSEAHRYALSDPALSTPPTGDAQAAVDAALSQRPDLGSLKANQQAADKFAQAQKALRYPTVNVFAAAGTVPVGDARFPDNYGAIGLNVSVPLFDGGKITALEREAKLRAMAAAEDVSEARNDIARAVRVAWLNVGAAWENISITGALLEAARQAAVLAQSRYDLGLTSMVELNQAQLSAVDAEITASRARYDYLLARAALAYQTGALR